MAAAYAAASNGATVDLYEKNEKLGKKIYITGKGRCNVTNDCEPETFFDNVVSNEKFMYSSYYSFDNNMVMSMMEDNGCKLKTERGGRVFPVSDHSSDVIRAMSDAMKSVGVNVHLNTAVEDITVADGKITGVLLSNGKCVEADSVVVATGGLSYPSTGSTGDGYNWLDKLGHEIVKCRPALVPFEIKEDCYLELQGLALKNVNVRLYAEDYGTNEIPRKTKPIYDQMGEMLFTHFGISGPLILSAASYYSKKTYGKTVTLSIDLKPALLCEQLDKRVLRDFEDNQNKSFKNAIAGELPSKLIPILIEKSGINPEKPVHEITKDERLAWVNALKDMRLTITGTRNWNEAIITQGGVKVSQIDPSTMESKLVQGLFVVGEILDVDALTGGFNLQIAWSTGHLAGMNV